MSWFEGGEGPGPSRGGGGDFGGSDTLLTILAIVGLLLIIGVCISAFGISGIFTALPIIVIIVCFFGAVFGGW